VGAGVLSCRDVACPSSRPNNWIPSPAALATTVPLDSVESDVETNESEMAFMWIADEFAYIVKNVINAVNYTFQSVLEIHNLDLRESVTFEELGRRGNQPNGEATGGWGKPKVHGPIAACVPQCISHLILQKFWDVDHILIHH